MAGGLRHDRDVVEAGAFGAVGQFVQDIQAYVGGVHVAAGTEQARELERLATGPGAGVEPAAGQRLRGVGQHELGAEVLDLDEAAAVGVGSGDVGVGRQAKGVGQSGG